jgi:hypothetical protein
MIEENLKENLIKERDDLRDRLAKVYSPFLSGYEVAMSHIIDRL